MRKLFVIFVALLCSFSASAQKKVSILGDSYSTFKGIIPAHHDVYYPMEGIDVTDADQTWWMQFINSQGYRLEKNNSWSGSTICNTGYGRADYSDRAFFARVNMLGNPDIIFVFGGTNDAWADSPIGEYKFGDWTKKDLYNFRPAAAFMLYQLKMLYPDAEIYYLLNSELKNEINESSKVVCAKYDVPIIELHDIEKVSGHPTVKGMKAISDQIEEFISSL